MSWSRCPDFHRGHESVCREAVESHHKIWAAFRTGLGNTLGRATMAKTLRGKSNLGSLASSPKSPGNPTGQNFNITARPNPGPGPGPSPGPNVNQSVPVSPVGSRSGLGHHRVDERPLQHRLVDAGAKKAGNRRKRLGSISALPAALRALAKRDQTGVSLGRGNGPRELLSI
jgi:hypothetical protein